MLCYYHHPYYDSRIEHWNQEMALQSALSILNNRAGLEMGRRLVGLGMRALWQPYSRERMNSVIFDHIQRQRTQLFLFTVT